MRNKIERQTATLKAGTAHTIPVEGGIDYNTELNFRHPQSATGKRLLVSFKDKHDAILSQTIQLEPNQTSYTFSDDDLQNLRDHDFDRIELLSKDDLHLEVWTDVPEITFEDL